MPQETRPSTNEYRRRFQRIVEKKELADRAYRSGSFQRAVDLFSEALTMVDQRDTATRVNLLAHRAAARTSLGRNEDAIRDCEQALYLKPDYPKVLLRKGRLHSRLGQWDLAIQALETCRDSSTARPETVREAKSELERCRQCKRDAQEKEERERRDAVEREQKAAEEKRRAQELATELRSKGHYVILGVARSAGASEIKKAYFKLAREHHPDNTGGDPVSAEWFKAIQRAYDVLRDPAERSAYDASLDEEIIGEELITDHRSIGHYATLGVARSADASEIRRAFFKLVREHHPDKTGGDPVSNERFKAIQRAYDVLRDPAERSAYDASL